MTNVNGEFNVLQIQHPGSVRKMNGLTSLINVELHSSQSIHIDTTSPEYHSTVSSLRKSMWKHFTAQEMENKTSPTGLMDPRLAQRPKSQKILHPSGRKHRTKQEKYWGDLLHKTPDNEILSISLWKVRVAMSVISRYHTI